MTTTVDTVRVPVGPLERYTQAIFERVGVPAADAAVAAEVLIRSDVRGIESHGVPRLDWYVRLIRAGEIVTHPDWQIVRETPAAATVDGGGGLGMVVGKRAMELAIAKAEQVGCGFVTVTNSRHYGIAGYYAELALAHDMIGLSMTNAAPCAVPTFGTEPRFGTNPLAIAIPAGEELPFLLDMATTTVAYGKLEIAARQGKPVPEGWALDQAGQPTTDPVVGMASRNLLPLGSTPLMSNFKGYGLGVAVDVLCGVLSGFGHGPLLGWLHAGHFFGAWRVDAFRPLDEFKANMDEMIRGLHATPVAPGYERVLIAGEREFLAERENRARGIPLHRSSASMLEKLGQDLGVPFPEAV